MASEPVRRYAPSAGGSGEASGGGRRTRRPRGRGDVGGESGGGGSFDISSLLGGGGSPLGALLSRYGDMMDANLEGQRAEIPRQAKAFDYYSRGKESELEDAQQRRDMATREATYARQRELAAGKEQRTAKNVADMKDRATRNDAAIGRGRAGYSF